MSKSIFKFNSNVTADSLTKLSKVTEEKQLYNIFVYLVRLAKTLT